MTYIIINREKSPTAAAVQLNNEILDPINLGQGRETDADAPMGALGETLKFMGQGSTKYPSEPGGPSSVRKAASNWIKRYIGIEATPETTFVVPAHGRDGLGRALEIASHLNSSTFGQGARHVALPDTIWPMVPDLARDAYLTPSTYAIQREGIDKDIEQLVAGLTKDQVMAAVYMNFPHNPTGMHIDGEENKKVMALLDRINSVQPGKTIRIDDIPYFNACPHKKEGAFLKSGYEGVLTKDSITPWFAVFSGSKAFATAEPGFHIMVVHPSLAAELTARLTRRNGLSYSHAFLAGMEKMLDPAMDGEMLAHLGRHHAKYVENRALTMQYLNNDHVGRLVVDGDAGMTSLLRIPSEGLGRSVWIKGENHSIRDDWDLAEAVANMCGVITVPNGMTKEGAALLRVAQALAPQRYGIGANALQESLYYIMNAPKLAA